MYIHWGEEYIHNSNHTWLHYQVSYSLARQVQEMAPILAHDTVQKYQGTEGGIYGGLVLLTIIIFIILIAGIFLCVCFSSEELKKITHNLLSLIYPRDIISTNKNGTTDVYLFGGKEFSEDKEVWRPKGCSTSCCHCWTYSYFLIMALLGVLWFITITVERGVYRKTGTCNDINVMDNRFTCFRVKDKSVADCSSEEDRNLDTDVFCYLLDISPSAIGIGYSMLTLVLFVTAAIFKITTKLAECESDCGRCALLTTQIILSSITIIAVIVIPPSIKHKVSVYFFYGDAVIRWAMYFLLIITIFSGALVPWCGFASKKKKYLPVVEKEKYSTVPQEEE